MLPCCVDVWTCLCVCVWTSCCMWSTENHRLSMYGSSCGRPCLILHARGERHNTFTSHSSTSSQGHTTALLLQWPPAHPHTVAPYICMHARPDRMCSRACDTCLPLARCTQACLCLLMCVDSIRTLAAVLCNKLHGWADQLREMNCSSVHGVYNYDFQTISNHLWDHNDLVPTSEPQLLL